MTRDDVIRMAREAGISDTAFDFQMVSPEDLERFAALVAAAEREAYAKETKKLFVQPAPSVPEKIKRVGSGFNGMFLREAQAYKQGWNECRAAMLAAAPGSSRDDQRAGGLRALNHQGLMERARQNAKKEAGLIYPDDDARREEKEQELASEYYRQYTTPNP